ncbi:hypothetical protein F5Y14DRAFT_420846 [Nemania sp. NC0429]|nr:hypothetical protein F5Y14DRAFT_420846 [Nemania sp. NC0429]
MLRAFLVGRLTALSALPASTYVGVTPPTEKHTCLLTNTCQLSQSQTVSSFSWYRIYLYLFPYLGTSRITLGADSAE